MYKQYNCGSLSKKDVDKKVTLQGWIKKIRKLKNLIFLDLGDRWGITQVVFNSEDKNLELFKNFELNNECVIEVSGDVKIRKSINEHIPTGEIEIIATDIKVFSNAKTTPFIIADKTDGLEELRLKYRYLDLRRNAMQNNLIFRNNVLLHIRNFFQSKDFIEVETPILTNPTPEGARDFLVPSRLYKDKFYALPQSPQIFKQLLMVSGFEKYFQIARCFRDEDLRSDRQLEFTQLDIETSFHSDKEIMNITEELLKSLMKKFLNINIAENFEIMNYQQAIEEYGSDKPDLRFEYKINDFNDIFKNTNFQIFTNILKNKGSIKGLIIDSAVSNDLLKKYTEIATKYNFKGIANLVIKNNEFTTTPISKFLSDEEKSNLLKKCSNNFVNKKDFSILIIAGETSKVNNCLGLIRYELGKDLKLFKEGLFKFVWIVNWPLFEYNNESKKWEVLHHPFTLPDKNCISNFDAQPELAKAQAYDIVLNGVELGGGSLRIYDSLTQNKMFKTLGMSEKEIKEKFGFLLESFQYGVPPHGGIAIGIDRMIMIMLNLNSIRDVIAFPKNSAGQDTMLEAPGYIVNK